MMPKKFHILITSELGAIRPFTIRRSRLKFWLLACSLFVLVATFSGIFFSWYSCRLQRKVDSLSISLDAAKRENSDLNFKVTELEFAVAKPLQSALGQLNERSRKIESILDLVGVEVKPDSIDKPEGGPYAQLPANGMDNLLYRVDSYLDVISPIPLGYPVDGPITSGFGRRRDPFTGNPAFHPGVDIQANIGRKVRATADGIVRRVAYDKGYGRYVLIDHGNGFKTVYGHNSKLLVKTGAHVVRGQVISLVGSTGRSTGPHLHYEVRYKNKLVNPRSYVRIAAKLAEQAQKIEEAEKEDGKPAKRG